MTDEQFNQRLHEITGLCWHECPFHNPEFSKLSHYKCHKCGLNYCSRTDLVNTWKGFGILWEFMQKHERWEDFISATMGRGRNLYLISPPALAKAVVEFFEEKK